MAKKKNLSHEDYEDVLIYEEKEIHNKINGLNGASNGKNGIKLQDIPIQVKCLNTKQKDLKKAIEEKDVVIATGSPGTGKTYLSLITALHLMKTEPQYKKLVLIKSLQVIKGESLGTLPGGTEDKISPYMSSFTSNLNKIFGSSTTTAKLIQSGTVELYPIAYIRGITWDNCMLPGTTILLESGEEIEISKLFDLFTENLDSEEDFNLRTYNLDTGEIEIKPMTQIAKNPINEECYEIETEDGRIIQLTGRHKLFVKDRGYVEIRNLSETDILFNI